MKTCVVNGHTNIGWYPQGTKRLVESLEKVGFDGDVLTYEGFPNDTYDKTNPYNIKASVIEDALNKGYTQILWLDCSVWVVRNPSDIFSNIYNYGYYFFRSGFTAAQTCSDKCLEYFNVDRDTAEKYMDCSSGIFGFNYNHNDGKKFIDYWLKAAKDNVFDGSRLHDNQSSDSRFLFHRQDQSAATMIINKLGLKMFDPNIHCQYYNEKEEKIEDKHKKIFFLLRGL